MLLALGTCFLAVPSFLPFCFHCQYTQQKPTEEKNYSIILFQMKLYNIAV